MAGGFKVVNCLTLSRANVLNYSGGPNGRDEGL